MMRAEVRLQTIEVDARALSDDQLEKLARFHAALARDEGIALGVVAFEADIAAQLRHVLAYRQSVAAELENDLFRRGPRYE